MNKKRYRALYYTILRTIAGFLAKPEKMLFFQNDRGFFSDNPRAICETMHRLYPDYKLAWVYGKGNDSCEVPEYVRKVQSMSFDYFLSMAAAFCIVSSEAFYRNFCKRTGQICIQTWHGDRGIKKILYDSLKAKGIEAEGYGDEYVTDYYIAGSDYAEHRAKTAFHYYGKVLKVGCPRNDCLVYPTNTTGIKEKIGVDNNTKLLLVAPTLRKNAKLLNFMIDIDDTIHHLRQKGDEWVCLVRAHPKSLGLSLEQNADIIDVSQYPDMADLLMIADMLITDYSSCAGDFILRKKPLILAQFDLEQYMREDRTFYVDINQIGFKIAHSQKELNQMIDTTSDEEFAENCEKIMRYFGVHEFGHSSETVCKLIDDCYRAIWQ